MRCVVALLMLASLCVAWQKKGKQAKPPEVTVIEVNCHRDGSDVVVDGRLKNSHDKPLVKLNLLFDFLGTDKQVLETKRGVVDNERLTPGDDIDFHLRVADPVRAVSFAIRAEERDGRELR